MFRECIELMLGFLSGHMPETVSVLLDSPVSHSQRHAEMIMEMLGKYHLHGGCQVVRSADWVLKQFKNGVISTSDTVIIEKAGIQLFDLPRNILESTFGASFIHLADHIETNG